MIGLLLLIGGLILMTAGSGWFAGAGTVGLICVAVIGVLLVLTLAFAAFGFSAVGRAEKRMNRRFDNW